VDLLAPVAHIAHFTVAAEVGRVFDRAGVFSFGRQGEEATRGNERLLTAIRCEQRMTHVEAADLFRPVAQAYGGDTRTEIEDRNWQAAYTFGNS